MIVDIINAFERKFNNFADTTDAFTSRFVRDEDSAIGTLCFSNFNVEFEYCLECGGMVEKSGLNIILDFSKRYPVPFRCMMYDIIGLVDKDNFSCWFYCFIESESRMELCFDKLSSDFAKVFPKIKEFANSADGISEIEKVLSKNIKTTVGIDLISDLNSEFGSDSEINTEETYDYLYSIYFGFEQCAFASDEYRDFLGGDFKKALRKYEKKKNRLVYEDTLIEYMNSCDEPEPVISEEYECLRDGLKEYRVTSGFVPFIASCGLLIAPFLIVCIGVYYAVSAILYRSAVYATSLELYNALYCIIPAFAGSMVAGYFLKEGIYRKFFTRKYQKMLDYDAIFNSEKSVKRMKVLLYLIYVVALIFVFLTANNGIAIYENGVNINSNYFDITGNFYSYNDTDYVEITSDKYVIWTNDGACLDFGKFATEKDIEEKILPALEMRGIDIIDNTTE